MTYATERQYRRRVEKHIMSRKCIIALILLTPSACATGQNSTTETADATLLLRSRLSETYMDGYSPLREPVAVTQANTVIFLNGPCAGLNARQCPRIENIPDLDPGRFLMRGESTPDEYSFYGFESIDRTAGIIAHEEFHRWQHNLQETAPNPHEAAFTDEARPYDLPSNEQISALLAEFTALKIAGSDNNVANLACLADAIGKREQIFEDVWNEYLSELQTREGIARYLELAYRFSGNRKAMREYMQQELAFEGTFESGDWYAVLRLFAYPMGGVKAMLITSNDGQLMPFDDLDQRIMEIANHNHAKCTNKISNINTLEQAVKTRQAIILAQQRMLEDIGRVDTAYIYRTQAPVGTFSFSRHIRMAEGALLVDHVSILLRNGQKFIDDEDALILLECTQSLDTFVMFRQIESPQAWLLHTRELHIETLEDLDHFIGLLCHQLRQSQIDQGNSNLFPISRISTANATASLENTAIRSHLQLTRHPRVCEH